MKASPPTPPPDASAQSASDVAPAPVEPAGHRQADFPLVIGALICVHASMAATRVAASLLVLSLGYAEWVVGGLLSLFAVAPIVMSMWAGRLADRHGLHRPLGVGVVMATCGAGLAAVTQHPAALALAALATGGAIAVAAVAIQREAGLMARDAADLKRVFSWVALGPAVSNALAPITVGLLIDHVGYASGFVFAAVLPVLAWLIARRLPRQSARASAQAAGRAPVSALTLLALPMFVPLLAVNLALSSCWDAHSFVVPVLGHARGLSASTIGLLLGAFAVAATVVRLGISRWSASVDEGRALRYAMVMASALCVSYAWLPGTAGMLAGSALLGLALGSVQPMILALLHQVTPADRHGQALGVRMVATNAATIVMPLGFGLLANLTGLPAAPLLLMAGLVALALWPARLLRGHALPG
ncbi:MAG: MFS transporter [Burkholderiales bacterium PBB6]|nr:MAG: MFS transporter [Burkholderiales bacterium PBB6]